MMEDIFPRKHCTWYKVHMLLRLLEDEDMLIKKRINYILWLDADAVVIHHEVKAGFQSRYAFRRDRELYNNPWFLRSSWRKLSPKLAIEILLLLKTWTKAVWSTRVSVFVCRKILVVALTLEAGVFLVKVSKWSLALWRGRSMTIQKLPNIFKWSIISRCLGIGNEQKIFQRVLLWAICADEGFTGSLWRSEPGETIPFLCKKENQGQLHNN